MIQNKHNKDLERKIDLYINGRLAEAEVDELWAELIQDEYYLDYAKSFANLKAIIEDRRTKTDSEQSHNFRKVVRYATTAAIVLIVGVLGVINYSSQNTITVSPIPEIGLDIVRSEVGVSADITNEVLKKAIQLAADGNSNEAKKILSEELATLNDPILIAEFSLTLGSIHYNMGEYSEAANSFINTIEQAGISQILLEKGYWLLANSYFQLDELDKAEKAFEATLKLDGQYSRIAQSYVKALNAMIQTP